MTNAFLPALRRSPHPRIVNISSGTASLTWSTNPNPQFTPGSGGAAAYRSSKAALNALTVIYAQTLAEDGFKVNALAPGIRATDLNPLAAAAGDDPAEAAQGAARLALLPDDGPTGGFWNARALVSGAEIPGDGTDSHAPKAYSHSGGPPRAEACLAAAQGGCADRCAIMGSVSGGRPTGGSSRPGRSGYGRR